MRGNADRYVAGGNEGGTGHLVPGAAHARRADAPGGWPESVELDVDGIGRVLFCHAAPSGDEDGLTEATAEAVAAPMLAGVEADLVVCGHTHHQFERTIAGVRIVNAGSVGLPQ